MNLLMLPVSKFLTMVLKLLVLGYLPIYCSPFGITDHNHFIPIYRAPFELSTHSTELSRLSELSGLSSELLGLPIELSTYSTELFTFQNAICLSHHFQILCSTSLPHVPLSSLHAPLSYASCRVHHTTRLSCWVPHTTRLSCWVLHILHLVVWSIYISYQPLQLYELSSRPLFATQQTF